jgi:hypothetical protein
MAILDAVFIINLLSNTPYYPDPYISPRVYTSLITPKDLIPLLLYPVDIFLCPA